MIDGFTVHFTKYLRGDFFDTTSTNRLSTLIDLPVLLLSRLHSATGATILVPTIRSRFAKLLRICVVAYLSTSTFKDGQAKIITSHERMLY